MILIHLSLMSNAIIELLRVQWRTASVIQSYVGEWIQCTFHDVLECCWTCLLVTHRRIWNSNVSKSSRISLDKEESSFISSFQVLLWLLCSWNKSYNKDTGKKRCESCPRYSEAVAEVTASLTVLNNVKIKWFLGFISFICSRKII